MFLRGSGGNFLARVLTLDPSTVPIGGGADTAHLPTNKRVDRYRYDDQFSNKKFNVFLDSKLSVWVDKELNQYYFPLTIGVEKLIELNLIIVEPMHPEHFEQKLQYFGNDDQLTFFYVDPTNCMKWIVEQRLHKGAYTPSTASIEQNTLDELNCLMQLLKKYDPISIKLENIIHSELEFLKEYRLACKNLKLPPYPTEDLEIYQSWKKTWKQ
jgi:hypothetical protein